MLYNVNWIPHLTYDVMIKAVKLSVLMPRIQKVISFSQNQVATA